MNIKTEEDTSSVIPKSDEEDPKGQPSSTKDTKAESKDEPLDGQISSEKTSSRVENKPQIIPPHRAYVAVPPRPPWVEELFKSDATGAGKKESTVPVIDLTANDDLETMPNVDGFQNDANISETASVRPQGQGKKTPKKEKIKQDAIQLPPEEVHKMIEKMGLTEYPVEEKKNTYRTITRGFLSAVYGGSPQEMYPTPRKAKVREHGISRFLCPNLLYNPHAAAMPGKPGLLFSIMMRPSRARRRPIKLEDSSDEDEDEEKPVPKDSEDGELVTNKSLPVFTRLGVNMWLYVGHYTTCDGDIISPEQWRMQPEIVKMTWAKNMLTAEWGEHTRTAILYRRLYGKEPFYEDVHELEARVKKGKVVFDVTVDEIYQSLERGDERVGVCGMQCTKYDVAFHDEVIANLDAWTPPPPKSKKGLKRKAPKKEESPSSPRKKRMKKEKSESPSLPEQEAMNIDDIDAIAEPAYVHKGTRSRPGR